MRLPRAKVAVSLALILAGPALAQTPLGTAFTYQGRLSDAIGPANGSYDFEFALYEDAGGSNLVGTPIAVGDLLVVSGLFTATLDFGPGVFMGSERWLEVRVRPGSGSGSDPYTPLAPLQQLTAGPNSQFAKLAGAIVDGAVGSAQIADGQVVRSLNGQTDVVTLVGAGGLSVLAAGGSVTVDSNATSTNVADAIVRRDSTGSFSAGGITVGANLELLDTTSALVGVITKNGSRFIHNYGSGNTFVGAVAGNTTMSGGSNSGFGANALGFNVSGVANSAFGIFALAQSQSGQSNSAFGSSALGSNVSGSQNAAFGSAALFANTAGTNNAAFGFNALGSNTTSSNSAFGAAALQSNTIGTQNAAFGSFALSQNQTGFANSAFGYHALLSGTGSSNSAFGSSALQANTSGFQNAAFGAEALLLNTGGAGNSAFGYQALMNNTTASSVSAFGHLALTSNTTGSQNSAFGYLALRLNTTANDNSAFGYAALAGNTATGNSAFGSNTLGFNSTGGNNSAFGAGALGGSSTGSGNSAFGTRALSNNGAGIGNTALGNLALQNLVGGIGNIAIGNNAGTFLTSGDSNIYIGTLGPMGAESNTLRLGAAQTAAFVSGIFNQPSPSGSQVFINSSGKLGTNASSRRYKHAIVDMGGESDVLQRLRPVSFYYRPEHDDSGLRQYGLIAEEVAEIAPQLVLYGNDGQPLTVRYHLVNAMLLNEVQKQRKLVEGQRQTIERQQALLEELAARLARLETLAQQ